MAILNHKTMKSIRLTINRQEKIILVKDIIYAQVKDKLCSIYLGDHAPYRLFLSIASLKAMLPSDGFLQISRSCLISLNHLQDVDSDSVILLDGTRLPYSHRQKAQILHIFQNHLSKQVQKQEHSLWKINIFNEFRCFDHSPFPFAIIEAVYDVYRNRTDYYFRYANEALQSMLHTPLHLLLDASFFSVIPEADLTWRQIFSQCASMGGSMDTYVTSSIDDRLLRVVSYQPHFGFCASLILEAERDCKPL